MPQADACSAANAVHGLQDYNQTPLDRLGWLLSTTTAPMPLAFMCCSIGRLNLTMSGNPCSGKPRPSKDQPQPRCVRTHQPNNGEVSGRAPRPYSDTSVSHPPGSDIHFHWLNTRSPASQSGLPTSHWIGLGSDGVLAGQDLFAIEVAAISTPPQPPPVNRSSKADVICAT